jgi:hypothetical protein
MTHAVLQYLAFLDILLLAVVVWWGFLVIP